MHSSKPFSVSCLGRMAPSNQTTPSAIAEIYADSEYTGEKQLVYLHVRSGASVIMCLKQNKKIKNSLSCEVCILFNWNCEIILSSCDFDVPNRPDHLSTQARGISPGRWTESGESHARGGSDGREH